MKNLHKGFTWLSLLVIAGLVIVGSGMYIAIQQKAPESMPLYQPATTTPVGASAAKQVQPAAISNGAPSIQVMSATGDGPARITFTYKSLPAKTSGIAVCLANGACTEWVANFKPPTPSGTATISTADNNSGSTKGLLAGKYRLMVIGTRFSDDITTSPVFEIQ